MIISLFIVCLLVVEQELCKHRDLSILLTLYPQHLQLSLSVCWDGEGGRHRRWRRKQLPLWLILGHLR